MHNIENEYHTNQRERYSHKQEHGHSLIIIKGDQKLWEVWEEVKFHLIIPHSSLLLFSTWNKNVQ